MQSDLLQQAIVDATALKEAAIKNAENTLIEKYSHEFEQTVQKLLEQEAAAMPAMPTADAAPPAGLDPTAAPADPAADMTAAPDLSAAPEQEQGGKALKNVPSSFLDGDDDEKLVINFDQIKQTMMEMFDHSESLDEAYDRSASRNEDVTQDSLAAGHTSNEVAQGEEMDLEEAWDELESEGVELELEQEAIANLQDATLEEDVFELEEEALQEATPEQAQKDLTMAQADKAKVSAGAEQKVAKAQQALAQTQAAELDKAELPTTDSMEITEEELMELAETLKVDVKVEGQSDGYMGSTAAQKREQRTVELAAARDDKAVEEREEEMEKLGDLVKENKNLAARLQNVESVNKNLVSTLEAFKKQVEQVNLSNAKLLYTNKALGNISLNERQKSQIVESISKADSVLAAKTIYETLQNAVENTPKEKEAPQSLREALNRANSPFVVKKTPVNNINDVMAERLKALAGIKK